MTEIGTGNQSPKPASLQWCLLVAGSALLAGLLELAHVPAALLIGPLVAAIIAGVNGFTVRPPRFAGNVAQAVVGVLIAASISLDIFAALSDDWLLILGVVAATLAASSFLGYLISRWKILPGTTGVWGSAPGAATAMVLMAGAFGADQRLVAFMQFLRVIMVTLAAAFIARLWVDTSAVEEQAVIWFPAISWPAFGATLAFSLAGGLAGQLVRLPSPWFLGAFIIAAIAHLGMDVPLQLPEWLLALSYAFIGWTIGLNFTRPILRHAMRALPQIIAAILALMVFCGALAWLIVQTLGVDPLTAYLATSPGGMDSVAIIAAASNGVDISFVMAIQAARFLVVLLLGPALSRLVTRAISN